ncbi:hypothetical protein GF354_01755, partial [Candidatus Peregrinibacteria bacterium]|nr:hypothetical protein [Candidatus Peregrinibacteria bacterium]
MAKEKNKKDLKESKVNSDESKEISIKKIIYIDIDDEITEIYNKIKPIGIKHIYLVVPKRAMLFQSIINLKILLKKTREIKKKIYLITNDSNGIYLAQQLGIPVFDKANNEGAPSLFSAEEDEKLRITPLKASVNAIDDEAPTRLSQRKLSISELLRKSKVKKDPKKKLFSSPIKNKTKKHKPKLRLVSPNRHALIGLISVSLIILLVIVYVALPGVTIHLTPSASVLEKSVNITLADYDRNRAELELHPHHTIASYPVSTTVEKTVTHFATGKRFSEEGRNASGKITIINTTPNTWPLIARTRFQTNEGIVFRIKEGVTVPAATSTGPGKLEAYVIADITDENGEVVGERGNIGPSKFFLPGLREDSRSKIYAESTEPMTGGITDYVTYVSEEDLVAVEE